MSEESKGIKLEGWDEVKGGASEEIFEAFLSSETDGYAILQLNRSDEASQFRFLSYDAFERQGQTPEINFYDTLYAGPLVTQSQDPHIICENLYVKFNTDRPEDFRGHSLSVSDVVALKRQQEINFYFVDSFGFKELPEFNSGRNPLRGMEDMIEQNDNQLDGIINNLPQETVAEKEAKSSVLEKLKTEVPETGRKVKARCIEEELS